MKIRICRIASGFPGSLSRRAAVSLLALFGSWAGTSQAASYTIYTDQAAWTAAVQSQYFLSYVVTTAGLSGSGLPSIYYYSSPSSLATLPNSSSAPLGTAFGGSFDLTPGGNGGGLAFNITFADGTSNVFWSAVNYPGGFWGIIADSTIDSVQYFSNNLTGNGETFNYSLLTVQFAELHICIPCLPRLKKFP